MEVQPEHIAQLLDEVRALRQQVDRLEKAVRRPERVKYTPDQAADRLGIGRSKLYELMREGRLPYHLEGRRRIITEAQIQLYEHQARVAHD